MSELFNRHSLAETIFGTGDLSMLNTAYVIRYPELTVAQVIAHDRALFPDNSADMGEATAVSLLTLSGGHPVLLHESLKLWHQLGELEACKSFFFSHFRVHILHSPIVAKDDQYFDHPHSD